MEQFVVSARKYRPATFDTVVGQEAVTETLKNAIRSKHLASAFLFTGPRGVGKTTCARILARTINCENLGDDLVACGKCQPCKTFDEGHSLNIFELDAASNNSVEDIRNLIVQVSIAPQVGTKKVYIIDEVHMLSAQAFNAFLKTLEEPPSYAIFILATTEKHKIIPTILSRCQVFDFRRITISDISRHLASIAKSEKIEAEPQALHVIAQKADGGLRDALSIFDQLVSFSGHTLTYADVVKNLNVLDHEHYFSLTESIVRGDIPAALVEYNAILQQGFDGHLFVSGLAHHFRDLLVSQDPSTLPLLEVSEELTVRYGEQAQQVDRELLVKGLDRLAQCDSQYKSSKEPRLLVELMLIQLCRINAVPNAAVEASAQKKSPDLIQARTATVAEPAQERPQPIVPAPSAPITQAQEPKPVTAQYVPKRRLAGQVSIKDTVSATAIEAAAQMETEVDNGVGMPSPSKPLNQALLNKSWNEYAQIQKRAGKLSVFSTLKFRPVEIGEANTIVVTIANKVQEKDMLNERPTLLSHLRREMDVPWLNLEVKYDLSLTAERPITTLQKFKVMAEKNPALLNLAEALDLDLH